MSTHNVCFHGEIRKISILLDLKKHVIRAMISNLLNILLMEPKLHVDAHAHIFQD